MNRKYFLVFAMALLACFLISSSSGVVRQAQAAYVTEITVDSTEDWYADGNSKTCISDTPCTLRRAINQAYQLAAGERPVLIKFGIPTSDANYDSTLQTWKITLTGTTSYPLRDLNGQVTIDGTTQPPGRTNGPRIIIDGQKAKNYGFVLRNNSNVVKGVAMQNFKTQHISISSSSNTVQYCWFGLSDDGQTLSSGDEVTYEGGSGVVVAAGCNNNTIRGNKFAGFWATACSLNGTGNVFAANRIGMRADGTVPLPSSFTKHPCLRGTGELWVGGVGITVAGPNNRVGGEVADRNFFAGLFLDLSPTSTQSPAIKVYNDGTGTIIKNNYIGVTPGSKNMGVCGRGIDLGSAPDDVQVLNNTISETDLSAILMNGPSIDGVTIQQNVIKRQEQWPGALPGNGFAEGAIAYGPKVDDPLRNFKPAAITSISVGASGTTVKGTSGAGDTCENCTVEVFLDDGDAVKECTKFMKRVTAGSDGKWTAFFATPLPASQGLRTMSTVPDGFAITGLKKGTTSNISGLYKVPKVSVTASTPKAYEAGAKAGVFTFTRDVTWGPLTVIYTISGGAKAGIDYYALSGKVSFPAGVKSKTVQVKPKNDTAGENNETVKVTITDKPTYNLGSPSSAIVTIVDND
ncbi:Calx-beta domain-containing protein [Syntrophobacter fumaroxidans]|uniref:Calx-beta domain-containing protein n=1 Tax=Syntrophobacter fumaroxidans (strain DSM 10017 / MPOB) TaxID=335543 RepID=A0LGN1_SYNFM|nr:hypothetical protein [Syntrophobacter fumaroxidans]ABK16583.1 hypothetical protein Sfum_0886 [Syntrophobacter fumaroxidans MPOB]